MNRILLDRFAPPAVVTTGQGDVVFIHGTVAPHLTPAPGPPPTNVLAMAGPELRVQIVAGLARAKNEEGPVVVPSLLLDPGTPDWPAADLHVSIIREPDGLRGLFLIAFPPPPPRPLQARPPRPGEARSDPHVLEAALASTQKSLVAAIQSVEAGNQELHFSNEEMQSTNQELQSANEELETAKEELESLNEELRSLNVDLLAKNQALGRSRDDLSNLLESTEIAILFVDRDLNIQRFTPQARRVLPMIPTDIGRPHARRVLATLIPSEVELRSADDASFRVRVVPYRTSDHVIDGIVITFTSSTGITPSSTGTPPSSKPSRALRCCDRGSPSESCSTRRTGPRGRPCRPRSCQAWHQGTAMSG